MYGCARRSQRSGPGFVFLHGDRFLPQRVHFRDVCETFDAHATRIASRLGSRAFDADRCYSLINSLLWVIAPPGPGESCAMMPSGHIQFERMRDPKFNVYGGKSARVTERARCPGGSSRDPDIEPLRFRNGAFARSAAARRIGAAGGWRNECPGPDAKPIVERAVQPCPPVRSQY